MKKNIINRMKRNCIYMFIMASLFGRGDKELEIDTDELAKREKIFNPSRIEGKQKE